MHFSDADIVLERFNFLFENFQRTLCKITKNNLQFMLATFRKI